MPVGEDVWVAKGGKVWITQDTKETRKAKGQGISTTILPKLALLAMASWASASWARG